MFGKLIKAIGFIARVGKNIWKNREMIEEKAKEAIDRTKNMDMDGDGKIEMTEVIYTLNKWVELFRLIAPFIDYLVTELQSAMSGKLREAEAKKPEESPESK